MESARASLAAPLTSRWQSAGGTSGAIQALIEDLAAARAEGTVRIFCGEAEPAIYNDEGVRAAVEAAVRERGVTLRVLTGPILLIDDHGVNGLLEWAASGLIRQLCHRPERGFTAQFRVVETDDGYCYREEFPHEALIDPDKQLVARLDLLSPRDIIVVSEEAISVFESWTEDCESWRPASVSAHLPLLATPSGLKKIIQAAESEDKVFDMLTADALLALPGAAKSLFEYARQAATIRPWNSEPIRVT